MAVALGEDRYRKCFAEYLDLLEEARQLYEEATEGKTDTKEVNALSRRGLNLLIGNDQNMEIALLDINLMEILFNTYQVMYGTLCPEKFVFDPKDFAQRIVQYCESADSSTGNVEEELGSLLLKKKMASLCEEHMRFQAPVLTSVLGTMRVTEKEKKPKEASEKKTKDIIEAVKRPQKVTKVKGRTLEETVSDVGRQLNQAYKDNDEEPLNFLEFVVDPKSFPQTVENLFHVSFLVNNADATIFVDDQEAPLIEPAGHYYEKGVSVSKTRHDKNALVMTLTREEWKDAISMFNITSAKINMKMDTAPVAGTSRHR